MITTPDPLTDREQRIADLGVISTLCPGTASTAQTMLREELELHTDDVIKSRKKSRAKR